MFKDLTTLENLQLAENGRTRRMVDRTRYRAPPEARGVASRKAGRLSGGEQEMLAIGRALVSNPTFCWSTNRHRASRR